MAGVLAAHIAGRATKFKTADQSAILKLEGTEVAAVGQHQADCPSYSASAAGTYRRISVRQGRLVGAIGIGDWPEQARVREAIKRGRRIWPWNINRFIAHGRLWSPAKTADVAGWPATAEICNCMSVCKQEIVAVCASGCASVEELGRRTGAGTVCGSCRPLLARLSGAPAEALAPAAGRGVLFGASLLAAIFFGLIVAFEMPFSTTVEGGWKPESLWTTPLIKQVTGFTLVGVSLIGMALSLRKRIRRFSLGDFGHWRAVHGALGAVTLMVLVTHTGLHLGANLNLLLMLNFLAVALTGALAGVVTALENRLQGVAAVWLRRSWTLLHILLVWPLPVLIFFHAFASYYY
jgi:nitrite reductase (NADH) large subunit